MIISSSLSIEVQRNFWCSKGIVNIEEKMEVKTKQKEKNHQRWKQKTNQKEKNHPRWKQKTKQKKGIINLSQTNIKSLLPRLFSKQIKKVHSI
jgi:hypothetical protein